MNLEELAEFVDQMIVQNDYPGFEPRSLKIGLRQDMEKAPARLFGQALGHQSVYVQLVALRWFQERPQYIKPHIRPIVAFLASEDLWLRTEAIAALERLQNPPYDMAVKVSERLFDSELQVQQAAAKALGKLGKRLKLKDGEIIEALNQVAENGDSMVKRKAEKALRKIGVYQ